MHGAPTGEEVAQCVLLEAEGQHEGVVDNPLLPPPPAIQVVLPEVGAARGRHVGPVASLPPTIEGVLPEAEGQHAQL